MEKVDDFKRSRGNTFHVFYGLLWVKEILLPTLKAGMSVIWDNATFHQSGKIRALIEKAGCKLLFLPTYSPDLNPIEHYWAKLKALIRRIRTGEMTIPQALGQIFTMDH